MPAKIVIEMMIPWLDIRIKQMGFQRMLMGLCDPFQFNSHFMIEILMGNYYRHFVWAWMSSFKVLQVKEGFFLVITCEYLVPVEGC